MKKLSLFKKSIAVLLSVLLLVSVVGVMPISAADSAVSLSVDGGEAVGYDTLIKAIAAANNITEGEQITITVNKDHSFTGPRNNTSDRYLGTLPLVIDGGNHTLTTTVYNSNSTGSITFAATADVGDNYNVVVNNLNIKEVGTSTTNTKGVIRIEGGKVKFDNVHIENGLVKGGAFHLDTRYYSKGDVNVEINNSTVISTANDANYTWIYADSTLSNVVCKVTNSLFITKGTKSIEPIFLAKDQANKYDVSFEGCTFNTVNHYKSVISVGSSTISTNVRVDDCEFYSVSNDNLITDSYKTNVIVQSSDKTNVKIYGSKFYGQNVLTLSNPISHLIAGVDDKGNNLVTIVDKYELVGTTADASAVVTRVAMPEMEEGASVRLNKDSSGIRFTTHVTAAQAAAYAALAGEGGTVEYGTLLALKSDLDAATNAWNTANRTDIANRFIPRETLDALGVAYIDVVADKGISIDEDGKITYRAAITGIPEDAYENEISAFAYVKVTDADGNVDYYYAGFDKGENTRSIKQVALLALDDAETVYTDDEKAILNKYAGVAQ